MHLPKGPVVMPHAIALRAFVTWTTYHFRRRVSTVLRVPWSSATHNDKGSRGGSQTHPAGAPNSAARPAKVDPQQIAPTLKFCQAFKFE